MKSGGDMSSDCDNAVVVVVPLKRRRRRRRSAPLRSNPTTTGTIVGVALVMFCCTSTIKPRYVASFIAAPMMEMDNNYIYKEEESTTKSTTHRELNNNETDSDTNGDAFGDLIPAVAPVNSAPSIFSFFDDFDEETSTTTTAPTSRPIEDPTPSPTPRPTPLPTARPTPLPTRSPIDEPTPSPTATPTGEEDGSSIVVIDNGTSPTSSPTMGPKTYTERVPYLTTTLAGEGIYPMSPEEAREWEIETSQRVMDFWEYSSLIEDLEVATRLTGQTPPYRGNTAGSSGTDDSGNDVNYKQGTNGDNQSFRFRALQQGTATNKLTVTYSQQITYTIPASALSSTSLGSSSSAAAATSPKVIVTQPFNTFSKRQQYMNMLLSADIPALDGLKTVYIVDVYEPVIPDDQNANGNGDGTGGGWMSYVIYGAIGAAGVLVLSIALACYCHSTGKTKKRKEQERLKQQQMLAAEKKLSFDNNMMPPVGLKPGMDARVQSIIEVEHREDDISTLGDPLGPYDKNNWAAARRNQSLEEQSVNENTVGPSIIHDFDYTKTFGGKFDTMTTTGSSTADTSNSRSRSIAAAARQMPNALGPSHSGDDEYSFDEAFETPSGFSQNMTQAGQRIEIDAPPGKLGVVIDTFDNGQPGVNAIRADSVLKHDLQIGDLLIEFDGQDTTHMTALEVSRMIGARSGNDVRKLVFLRYRQ